MRQFKFDRPLVKSSTPIRYTRCYYVNVDENTGMLANVMEFVNGHWQVKFLGDNISAWKRSAERLDIPNKIKLGEDSILADWLAGTEYEDDVKKAADDASLGYTIGVISSLLTAANAVLPVIDAAASAATAAGDTETAEALSEAYTYLHTETERLSSDDIDKLEDLNDVIYGTSEEVEEPGE